MPDYSSVEIIYQDEYLAAVYKPAGLFVHRSSLDTADTYLLQIVRDMLGQRVYPLHRLDRPTSGFVLFALSSEIASVMCNQFRYNKIRKKYMAIVRGWLDSGEIDYPLLNERKNKRLDAVTEYRCIDKCEYPFALGKHDTVRYSLVKISPKTGRMHQIRRHMKHIFHPVIGDTTYGDGKHNRLFRDKFDRHDMQLRAVSLEFSHPVSGEKLSISLDREFSLRLPLF